MSYDYSRLKRLALIALALQSAGRINGRTKLQKIVYFANLVGWNAFDFKYHNFGPYSDTLASEIDTMRNSDWVHERALETNNERILYQYSFSTKRQRLGASLVGKVEDASPQGEKLISLTRGLIKQLNNFSSDELEIMSTIMFLSRQDPSLSEEQLVAQTYELKPQFDKQQIAKGLRIFRIMKNVPIARTRRAS